LLLLVDENNHDGKKVKRVKEGPGGLRWGRERVATIYGKKCLPNVERHKSRFGEILKVKKKRGGIEKRMTSGVAGTGGQDKRRKKGNAGSRIKGGGRWGARPAVKEAAPLN